MIVNGDGQGFFRVLLPDAKAVKLPFDFRRPGHGKFRLFFLFLKLKLAVKDVFAEDDAVVANINARPGDELADFRVRLAAETAHRDVGRSGHVKQKISSGEIIPSPAFFHSGYFCAG
jgi:hypothetical protein